MSRHARRMFAALAERLLAPDSPPIDKLDATKGLFDLFGELGGSPQDITGAETTPWLEDIALPDGLAISPYYAATCLQDYMRTCAFVGGVQQAIAVALERFPGERISLLYAGTGPFAPLALLQAHSFSPQQVGFTLLDVHPTALDCLTRVVSGLALDDYVVDAVQADATRWEPPGGNTYHVIVAEVMQRALTKEPQVAVTLNLAPHLCPGGVFVPERIDLDLCLFDPGKEFRGTNGTNGEIHRSKTDERIAVGTAFKLVPDRVGDLVVSEDGYIPLPDMRLPAEGPIAQGGMTDPLYILTRITTFGDLVLDEYQSGLTHPHRVDGVSDLRTGQGLRVRYALGERPGLEVRAFD